MTVRPRRRRTLARLAMALLGAVGGWFSGACSGQGVGTALAEPIPAAEVQRIYRQASQNPDDAAAFERLLSLLPRVGDRHVFEGDLLLGREELRQQLRSRMQTSRRIEEVRKRLFMATKASDGTTLMRQASLMRIAREALEIRVRSVGLSDGAGRPISWKTDERKLSYAISASSFGAFVARYQQVKADLAAATRSWETACPDCGISFVHLAELDRRPDLAPGEAVRFVVRYYSTELPGAFVAASFFPNALVQNRVLLVDRSYFELPEVGTSYDRVGVMRHELGHVLGLVHEHVAGVAGCRAEGGTWVRLTAYDPFSVMHYFCGPGHGTTRLEITELDRAGLRKLYVGSSPKLDRETLERLLEGLGEKLRLEAGTTDRQKLQPSR